MKHGGGVAILSGDPAYPGDEQRQSHPETGDGDPIPGLVSWIADHEATAFRVSTRASFTLESFYNPPCGGKLPE